MANKIPTPSETAMDIDFKTGQNTANKSESHNLFYWLIGVGFSVIPLFIFEYGKALSTGAGFYSIVIGVLSNAELFFVCSSLLVSATFELYSKNRQRLNAVLLLFVLCFAILYAVVKDIELSASATNSVARATFGSLIITLILGSIAFKKKG